MTFSERRARIAELQALIAALRADAQARHDTLTKPEEAKITQDILDLGDQLSAVIADGANPCPQCKGPVHGMVQYIGVKGDVRAVYEVGCLPCPDVRAIDLLPELAVERFNAGQLEPPSNGPGVKLEAKAE